MAQKSQVSLVYMPFGSVCQPALGISLLKPALTQRGIACDIHYLNIPFAEQIGLEQHEWIAQSAPQHLLGEWLFACELFGQEADQEADYLDYLAELFGDMEAMPDFTRVVERLQDLRAHCAASYLDTCLSAVHWKQYKIIGFSTVFQQNIPALALARRIKARWPDKVIVFGGANCEGEMGLELHRLFPFVDFVCRGESDELFPNLIERLLAGETSPALPGLVARRDGQSVAVDGNAPPVADMDRLPYLDFDDYFRQLRESSLEPASEQVRLLIETSRGCWYGARQPCAFCGLNGEAKAFRSKGADRVVDELTYLVRRYEIEQVRVTDNVLDMQYLQNVMPRLAGDRPDWSIMYDVRVNLDKEQLRLLKQAGVEWLQPGIESLSTGILSLMRKGSTVLQNVQLLKWASEAGVNLAWPFLMGFPGEDPDDYARMAGMIPALVHLEPPKVVTFVGLHRFSPYFDDPQTFGIANVRAARSYRLVYPFSDDALWRLACFFDFDYADGRDPKSYTAPIVEAMDYWREHYRPAALTSASEGQTLLIYDWRPGARQTTYRLEGMQRAAYEYCDESRSLGALQRHLVGQGYKVDETHLSHLLEEWVAGRLMLRDGDRFLTLAVPGDSWGGSVSGSDVIHQALVGAVAQLVGSVSRGEHVKKRDTTPGDTG